MTTVTEDTTSLVTVPGSLPADRVETWTARPPLAPRRQVDRTICRQARGSLRIDGSGSPGCYGGWEVGFTGIRPQHTYLARAYCKAQDVADLIDSASLLLFWRDADWRHIDYDYLLPGQSAEGWTEYSARSTAPERASTAVLQCALRWTGTGSLWWTDFSLHETDPLPQRRVRACCATAKPVASPSVEHNVEHFCRLLDETTSESPDLVCLPECVTSWGVQGKTGIDCARPIPGPETDAFRARAKAHGFVLGLSMNERDGDLVYNTGVIFGRDGEIIGKYRKVHLAIREGWDGTSPGSEWPVFDTDCGRIGMTICKDSSIPESARCLAARGMQILLMPIMGDHRAVYWRREAGHGPFDPDRWLVIQRARAMDNHIYMVICRNNGEGSCIIAPDGDVLAYNSGDTNIIAAEIEPDRLWRVARGATYRDSVWAERRPHLYENLYG